MKPFILPNRTHRRKSQALSVSNFLIGLLAFIGITQIAHLVLQIMNDQIFDSMRFFLAAVVGLAVFLILRLIDAMFGVIDHDLRAETGLKNAF